MYSCINIMACIKISKTQIKYKGHDLSILNGSQGPALVNVVLRILLQCNVTMFMY